MLERHNRLRRKVAKGEEARQPPAANMRKVVWNTELEAIAQRWADQCIFNHDPVRHKQDRTMVGQNAYTASGPRKSEEDRVQKSMGSTVQAWYDEVKNPGFNPQGIRNFKVASGTGHYTQVVWAETEEVGCGMVEYKERTAYKTLVVCNYAVMGNFRGSELYEIGKACTKCPEGYACQDGLCAK